jgi:anti-sigma factor RsiW
MTLPDTTLRAYVDSELPPDERERVEAAVAHSGELAERVAALRASCLPYRAAFDTQALAPVPESLVRGLDTWVALAQSPAPPRLSRRRWLGVGGALAASFAAGLWWPRAGGRDDAWVEAIVGYQALYARETVSELSEDPAQTQRVLRDFGARVGRAVTVPDLAEEGLAFKRAQLLAFGTSPLLQMVYLPAAGAPVALCVLPQSRADGSVAARAMASLQVATGQRDGLAFALVADRGVSATQQLAQGVAQGRYRALRS